MTYLFQNKVAPDFIPALVPMADDADIDVNCSMFVMNNESGLRTDIVNSIGCTGLIQFCPDVAGGDYKTIGGVRYLLSDIAKMSAADQLKLVFTYWDEIERQYGKFATCYDLYLATFYPYAISRPDDYVLGSEKGMAYAKKIAQQNPMFNIDKNGVITKGEFKKWMDAEVYKKVPTQYYDSFFKKKVSLGCIEKKLFFGAELRLAS